MDSELIYDWSGRSSRSDDSEVVSVAQFVGSVINAANSGDIDRAAAGALLAPIWDHAVSVDSAAAAPFTELAQHARVLESGCLSDDELEVEWLELVDCLSEIARLADARRSPR